MPPGQGACGKPERGMVECQVVDVRVEKQIKIKALTDDMQVFEALTGAPFFEEGNYKTGKAKSFKLQKRKIKTFQWLMYLSKRRDPVLHIHTHFALNFLSTVLA